MRWALAAIAVAATACSSPTTPTAEQSDFSGVWQGEYLVTACSSGRVCIPFQNKPLSQSFSVRLSQTGTSVIGVLTIGGFLNVDVAGTLDPGGVLTLTGSRPAASAFDPTGDVQVTRLAVQRDSERGLTGKIEYVSRYTVEQNHETAAVSWAGDVTTARRLRDAGPQPSSFGGRWGGNYVVRRCVAVGWTFCSPGEQDAHVYTFDVRLTQNGATLTGTMAWSSPAPDNVLPVTGTVSLDTLTIQGSATAPASGVDANVLRITRWTTTRDDLGRMHGSFGFVRETHWSPASVVHPGEVWTLTYDAELVDVALQVR